MYFLRARPGSLCDPLGLSSSEVVFSVLEAWELSCEEGLPFVTQGPVYCKPPTHSLSLVDIWEVGMGDFGSVRVMAQPHLVKAVY